MFGWIRERLERRASTIDVGAVLQTFFFSRGSTYSWLSASPATLAGSVGFEDGEQSLVTHSRRLCRISPLLRSYESCMVSGVLTGEPEAPAFGDAVPEATAKAAADLWLMVHEGIMDLERDVLCRLIEDGDVLLLEGRELVPADQFEAVTTGPEWAPRVEAWRIGKAQNGRRAGVVYIGDRKPGAVRAAPWVAGALPAAAGLVNARVSGAHAIGSLARLAMLLKADTTRQAAVMHGVRSGVQSGEDTPDVNRQELTSAGVGAVPLLRPGESTARATAGPDETAQAYEHVLEMEVGAALHLPLSELRSDYSTGSYSNLRMAWQDAEREYQRRRRWFHRAFRLPFYLDALTGWIAGDLTGVTPPIMAALKRPVWPGPRREPPQPEKELMAVAALARAGMTAEAQQQLNPEGGTP